MLFFAGLGVFHLAVAAGVAPQVVWGGRIKDAQTARILEIIAAGIRAGFWRINRARLYDLQARKPRRGITLLCRILAVLLAVSSLGNLTYEIKSGRYLFAPLAGVAALLALRLALERPSR